MAWRLVLLANLCGCGRLMFDPQAGADARVCLDPIGHDEDGDGIDDQCDVCPQVADDQRDTDGDRVGDACDLAATHEMRTVFEPMIAMHPGWDYGSSVTFNGDSITMPGLGASSYFSFNDAPGRTVVEVGGRITMPGSTTPQVAIHIGEATGSINYYCELFDDGPFELKLTHFNNGYTVLAETPIPGTFTPGSTMRLLFEHLPPSLRCVVWWNGIRYEVTGTDPGDVPANAITFAISDINMEIENAVRLVSP